MFDIHPSLYHPVYLWSIAVLCMVMSLNYMGSSDCHNLLKKNSMVPTLIITIILILFIGLRPVSFWFGDTINYAYGYRIDTSSSVVFKIDTGSEWLWYLIQNICESLGLSVNMWFLVIAVGYWGFAFLAFKRLLWENPWLAMLFFLIAFSTYTFGTNGLRNGLACSMVMYAMSLLTSQQKTQSAMNGRVSKKVSIGAAAVIAFLALGIHRSVMLPIAACLAAIYVIKSPRTAIYFWLASIPISLVMGGAITNFFAGLGFDDRMTSYVNNAKEYEKDFSGGLGFRWDFLLYSAMPVWLIWHITSPSKKNKAVTNGTADAESMRIFNILAITYILANAFWVMVIRAAFSNRFAYLSWFLHPVVFAYALIRLQIWKDQDRKAALILLAYSLFTIVLFLLGK